MIEKSILQLAGSPGIASFFKRAIPVVDMRFRVEQVISLDRFRENLCRAPETPYFIVDDRTSLVESPHGSLLYNCLPRILQAIGEKATSVDRILIYGQFSEEHSKPVINSCGLRDKIDYVQRIDHGDAADLEHHIFTTLRRFLERE